MEAIISFVLALCIYESFQSIYYSLPINDPPPEIALYFRGGAFNESFRLKREFSPAVCQQGLLLSVGLLLSAVFVFPFFRTS